MTFLKQNWFKSSLASVIILVGISISYYFFLTLPAEKQAEVIRIKEKECTNLGQERYKQDTKDESRTVMGNIYKYNKQLDSCFYLFEYSNGITFNYAIIDLKTNITVARYYEMKNFPAESSQIVYYVQKKDEIFYAK